MPRTLDLARRAELAARAVAALRGRSAQRWTMSDLAAAIGIKRPTLYFYFRDLAGLLDAAFDDAQRRYLETVTRRAETATHPIDQLIAIARATAELQAGQRDLVVVLFQLWAVGGADPERLITRGREGMAPLRATLIARLADGVDAGLVAPCDPSLIVDLMLATFDGVTVAQIIRRAPPGPVIEEMIARVLEPRARRPAAAARRTRTPRSPR